MSINPYREKDIRDKIINKIKPKIKKGRSKHEKGYVYIGETMVCKVKIPNAHDRIMKKSKSQYMAENLHLEDDQFNALIDCPLTGPQYYDHLKKELENNN